MTEHVTIAIIGAVGMVLSASVPFIVEAWKTKEQTGEDIAEWCPPREEWGPM